MCAWEHMRIVNIAIAVCGFGAPMYIIVCLYSTEPAVASAGDSSLACEITCVSLHGGV